MQLLCSFFDQQQSRLTVTQWDARTDTAHMHVCMYMCTPLLPVLNAKSISNVVVVSVCAGLQTDMCYILLWYMMSSDVARDTLHRLPLFKQKLIVKRDGQEPSPASHWWMSIVLIGSRQEELLPGIKPLVSAALGENFRPVPPVYQHTFVWLRPCISLNRPHYESMCKYLEAEEAEDASLG